MRFLRLAALCVPFAVAVSAQADELPFKPGLWKTTMNMTSPFGGGVNTRTSEECVEEESFDPASMLEDAEGCELTKNEIDGNELNFIMECSMDGADALVRGRFESDGDSGNGEMTMDMNAGGMQMQMKMDWTSERIGDC